MKKMDWFQAEAIRPGITRIHCPGNVFAYLITGRNGAVLIDSGLGLGDLAGFAASLTELPVSLVCTHGHLDHTGGAASFEKAFLCGKDFFYLQDENEKQNRYDYLCSQGVGGIQPEDLQETRRDGWMELEMEKPMDLGGISLVPVPIPGHTPGSAAIWMPEAGVLLTGDGLCSMTLFNLEGCTGLSGYVAAIGHLQELVGNNIQTMLYSHPHNFGSPEILQEMKELCVRLLEHPETEVPLPDWGENILCGAAMNAECRRLDGKAANIVIIKERIC